MSDIISFHPFLLTSRTPDFGVSRSMIIAFNPNSDLRTREDRVSGARAYRGRRIRRVSGDPRRRFVGRRVTADHRTLYPFLILSKRKDASPFIYAPYVSLYSFRFQLVFLTRERVSSI